ncbi:hypothetical protein OG713_44420 (plasmid) [Streptomyces sp. NBC_00723]|uniref:hypothetical protein n=1 Tax=Streptomyces sp. NBC_00723 TaxID=2903673 RepID=UPI002F9101F4
MAPLLLPTTATAITTLVTTCTTARTETMRRHEDALLDKAVQAADYSTGLDHIARIRQATAPPPPDPAAQTQQPAEPPTPPP